MTSIDNRLNYSGALAGRRCAAGVQAAADAHPPLHHRALQ
ncbi:unnamed protein product, partial [Strongylus vulgaris]